VINYYVTMNIYLEYSPNSTWLVSSRLNTTRHVRHVERVKTSVLNVYCRAVLFKHGGRRTSYSAPLYKFSRVVFIFLHTQILFVPSNKIN